MKAMYMKLSGCASKLLAHEDLEHMRKLVIGIVKFYNVNFSLVYENEDREDSLYEMHGATLKHKCGKRIVMCPPLYFSLILFFIFFGVHILPSLFSFLYPHM